MDFLLLGAANTPDDVLRRAAVVLGTAGDVRQEHADEPAELDASLAGSAGRVVVVAGDDRRLRSVLARAWRRRLLPELQVGVLPLGRAGLARHLGLPDTVEDAAARIVDGAPRRLDLIRDDQAGVVVDAAYVGAVADDRPQGTLRMLKRALLPTLSPLRVEVDDEVLADWEPTASVVIGNGPGVDPELTLADAVADDGLLDVVVLGAVSRRAPKGPTGQPFRPIRRARGRAVNIYRRPDDTVPASADGEPAGMRERRCWWVEPHSWTLIS